MPVLDHEVHESVRITSSTKYGCYNKKIEKKSYLFREFVGNQIQIKFIENSMSLECRYDRSLTDNRCSGCCNRGSGERYVQDLKNAIESVFA